MPEIIQKESNLMEIEHDGSIYRIIDVNHKKPTTVHKVSSELRKELIKKIQYLSENKLIPPSMSEGSESIASKTLEVIDYSIIETIIEQQKNPTVKNYFMIERLIAEHKFWKTKSKLYRSLPHSMQYPVFTTILQLLEHENKIRINDDGSIIWTRANSQLMKELEDAVDA